MAKPRILPVRGFPGYFVSDHGDVYSTRVKPWLKLKPWSHKYGYPMVGLRRGNKSHRFRIHVLVARMFLGRRPSARHGVMHEDDNPRNNHYKNLSWGTQLQNIRGMANRGRHYSVTKPWRVARGKRHGSKVKPESVRRGEQHCCATITEKQVRLIRRLKRSGLSISETARRAGASRNAAKSVLRGKTWRHVK